MYIERLIKVFVSFNNIINSSPLSDAYMHQWIGSVLVQIMACHIFGTKPLSEPMLGYCQLNPKEQTSVKFQSKSRTFHSQKCIWKYRMQNGGHFVRGTWIKTDVGVGHHHSNHLWIHWYSIDFQNILPAYSISKCIAVTWHYDKGVCIKTSLPSDAIQQTLQKLPLSDIYW